MKRFAFLGLVIAAIGIVTTGCAGPPNANLDIALTDGTHAGGWLVAVTDDWLVLDHGRNARKYPLLLLDYSLIDTIVVQGQSLGASGAFWGGLIGALGGALAASGFDSSMASKEHTRTYIGLGAGAVAGAAVGYLIGRGVGDTDIVLAQPDAADFAFLQQYALYPDTLPHDLERMLDSVSMADSLSVSDDSTEIEAPKP